MRNRTGAEAAGPGPGRSCSAPATRSQQDERHHHDARPTDGREASLDAYIARLLDEAPPLSGEQRDALALILRRPRRSWTA